ncbi:MAG: hypothetical protein AB8B97_04175 [Granulosicoccus sp.]
MNIVKTLSKVTSCALLVLAFNPGIAPVQAEDIVPAKDQSDEQISIWVDDAQLELFISQLAQITGRDVAIDGELQGQVSGRFNGSITDTLGAVSEQFSVLFDLDDSTLGAVASTSRSSATIAMGSVELDEQLESELMGSVLPGNKLEIRDSEILVSGHPSYVSRLAKVMISAVARADKDPVTKIVATADTDLVRVVDDADTPEPEPVMDSAAEQILAEAAREVEAATASQATSQVSSQATRIADSDPEEILWVTDIPGYETF